MVLPTLKGTSCYIRFLMELHSDLSCSVLSITLHFYTCILYSTGGLYVSDASMTHASYSRQWYLMKQVVIVTHHISIRRKWCTLVLSYSFHLLHESDIMPLNTFIARWDTRRGWKRPAGELNNIEIKLLPSPLPELAVSSHKWGFALELVRWRWRL